MWGIVVVMLRLWQHTLLYCFWFMTMRGLRQHNLLGIIDGYAKFLGNTLYWASAYRSDVGRLHQWVQDFGL
jgi:hypothetical protein